MPSIVWDRNFGILIVLCSIDFVAGFLIDSLDFVFIPHYFFLFYPSLCKRISKIEISMRWYLYVLEISYYYHEHLEFYQLHRNGKCSSYSKKVNCDNLVSPDFLLLRASSQFTPSSKLTIDHRTKDGTTTKTFHCHEPQ